MRLLHRIVLPCFLLVFFGSFGANTMSAKCIYLQPVKIKKIEVGNMLSWSTYQEVDNKFFVIEKSENGIEWKKAGDVPGAGNSNKVHTYRFLDLSIGEKKTYYRLLHYASDRSFTVSETFIVERSKDNNLMITSMSSTVTDRKLSLTIASTIETSLAFELKKMNGEVITRGKKKVTAGLNALAFDCSKLPNGKYEVILKGNHEQEKIIIRKVKSSEMPRIDYEVKK